jgi:hypothetical protein
MNDSEWVVKFVFYKKGTGIFCRKKAQKAQEISAARFCAFSRLRVFA